MPRARVRTVRTLPESGAGRAVVPGNISQRVENDDLGDVSQFAAF